MPSPNAPDTPDVATALQTYLQAVQFPNTSTNVYVANGVQLGKWKDISDLLPVNGSNVVGEIHGAEDVSERYSTGGRVKDRTNFYILSLCDLTTSSAAWTLMYRVRDAIIPYLMQHAQLAGTGNVLLLKLIAGGDYKEVFRSGKWYLGYLCKVEVVSKWVVSTGFIS